MLFCEHERLEFVANQKDFCFHRQDASKRGIVPSCPFLRVEKGELPRSRSSHPLPCAVPGRERKAPVT